MNINPDWGVADDAYKKVSYQMYMPCDNTSVCPVTIFCTIQLSFLDKKYSKLVRYDVPDEAWALMDDLILNIAP